MALMIYISSSFIIFLVLNISYSFSRSMVLQALLQSTNSSVRRFCAFNLILLFFRICFCFVPIIFTKNVMFSLIDLSFSLIFLQTRNKIYKINYQTSEQRIFLMRGPQQQYGPVQIAPGDPNQTMQENSQTKINPFQTGYYPYSQPPTNFHQYHPIQPIYYPPAQLTNQQQYAPTQIANYQYPPAEPENSQPANYQQYSQMSLLDKCEGVYVLQKMDFILAPNVLEKNTAFLVYQGDRQGGQMGDDPMFRVKENNTCCERNCLPIECRPLKFKVHQYRRMITKKNKFEYPLDGIFIHTERPKGSLFYCISREFMGVHHIENGVNEQLGSLRSLQCCSCKNGVEIYDKDAKILYIIEADSCQSIFCCNEFWRATCSVNFDVFNASGQHLVQFWKESDYENGIRVVFPRGATRQQKALLMTAAVFLDHRYFEKSLQTGKRMPIK